MGEEKKAIKSLRVKGRKVRAELQEGLEEGKKRVAEFKRAEERERKGVEVATATDLPALAWKLQQSKTG